MATTALSTELVSKVQGAFVEFFPEEYRARVIFENRYEVSIIWGPGTYSDNQFAVSSLLPPELQLLRDKDFNQNPEQVEIAVFSPDGEWVTGEFDEEERGDGQVLGWVSRAKLLEILQCVYVRGED